MPRPEYQRAVCERLRLAAAHLRERRNSRRALIEAGLAIHVLTEDEFPADYRNEFREIMSRVTGSASMEEVVGALTEDEVFEVAESIVRLHEECCSQT